MMLDTARDGEEAKMVTRLDTVTADEWQAMAARSGGARTGTADAMLALLRKGEGHFVFEADHLTHQLQTATRAERDGADDEIVLAALFHDVAETFAPLNHPAVAAAMLRPYVRDDVFHVMRTHQDFQGRYYYESLGMRADAYLDHADEVWFPLAMRFSDEWDQASFDPAFPTEPLEHFEPMVRRMLDSPRSARAAS
jgi:predicted HD phosphohydrolase